MDTEQYINKLFVDAGWHEGRELKIPKQISHSLNSAYQNAIAVLTEFGGLNVGEIGFGREASTSDISFRKDAFDFGSKFHNHWRTLNSSLFAFASAHQDHILLLVDNDNNFYIFTDPDEQLYKIGRFDETVARLLLGLNYGMALEKS